MPVAQPGIGKVLARVVELDVPWCCCHAHQNNKEKRVCMKEDVTDFEVPFNACSTST